jgi:hypothetical protein
MKLSMLLRELFSFQWIYCKLAELELNLNDGCPLIAQNLCCSRVANGLRLTKIKELLLYLNAKKLLPDHYSSYFLCIFTYMNH